MKSLRKIFNIASSVLIALSITGCAGLEEGLVSCLEDLKGGLEPPPSPQDTIEVPTSMELIFPQGRFSKTTETQSYKDCFVIVNDGLVDPSIYDIEWKIDGTVVQSASEMYTFAPSSEEKIVSVEVVLSHTEVTNELDENGELKKETTTLSSQTQFVYYAPIDSLEAKRSDSNGVYTFYFDDIGDNYVVEWFVNGEKMSQETTFTFNPTYGGIYNVSAMVNGEEVVVQDNQITHNGVQRIRDIVVDYDTYYPSVKISFNGDNNAQYKMQRINGSNVEEFTFYGNTTFIPFSSIAPNTNSVSTIKIKTINSAIYNDEEYTASVSVLFPNKGLSYLADSYGFENRYITSKNDFYKQFDYMLLSREQPQEEEYTTKTCEFWFEYEENDISKLVSDAFDTLGYTGSYKLNASRNASVYTITVQFYTGNVCDLPSTSTKPNKNDYANNINAYPLSISSTGREFTSLPIDNKIKIPVTNTEQLYRIAELGYCPVPQQGSVAETVWENARDILAVITDEQMSDYQNALALYDWIMYKNKYDNGVVSLSTSQAVKQPAFYLEGLIYDKSATSPVYAESYGYTVCDGISKTYSLLSNMLGLQCIRVVGEAGYDESWGGHAWNKIKIEGQWYIVDATWGDSTMGFSYKTNGFFNTTTKTKYYELGLHNYFLVTDSFVYGNHREEVENYYPKTASIPYDYYKRQSFSYNGKTADAYLNESGTDLEEQLEIIGRHIVNDVNIKNKKQEFTISTQSVKSDYFMYELGYTSYLKSEVVSSINSLLAPILKSADLKYSLFEVDGTICVIVANKQNYSSSSYLPSSPLVIE